MEGIVSMNNIVTTSPCRLHSSSSSFSAFVRFPTRVSTPARPSLRFRFTKICAITSNDIKVGTSIEVDGAPWKILEFLHVKPGKGAAFVRTKMKNFITGSVIDKTFRAGCPVDEADVVKEVKQYSYKDGSLYVFMDMTTYEEIRLNEKNIGDKNKYLKEGMECTLLFWNERVIDFDLPVTAMAYLRSSLSRPFLSTIRSATVRSSPSIPRAPHCPSPTIGFGSSLPRFRVQFNTPRSAAAMGGALSLLPLHSVVAAVRLNSKLFENSTACCGSFKDS